MLKIDVVLPFSVSKLPLSRYFLISAFFEFQILRSEGKNNTLCDIQMSQSVAGAGAVICGLSGLVKEYLTRPQAGISYLSASDREGRPSDN